MTYEKNEWLSREAFEAAARRRNATLDLSSDHDGQYLDSVAAAQWAMWCEGMAYQAGLASEEFETKLRPDEARQWAWDAASREAAVDGWPIEKIANYIGFFNWGWAYRGQYEQQRMALPKKATAHDIPAWRDKLGGYTEALTPVEKSMNQEIAQLRNFIALHLARLSPIAFQQYEYCYICEDGAMGCDGQCGEATLFSRKKADTPELRALLKTYRTASFGAQAEEALEQIFVFVNSKVAIARNLGKRKDEPNASRGERITKGTYETLSMLSTFMGVALTLLPNVSWHDAAEKMCKELKELLNRNFAVQILPEQGRNAGHQPVADKIAFGDLVLPFAMQARDGGSEKYAQGFNSCLEKVIALNNTPNGELKLPNELTWTESSNPQYLVGFNACREKVKELNKSVH